MRALRITSALSAAGIYCGALTGFNFIQDIYEGIYVLALKNKMDTNFGVAIPIGTSLITSVVTGLGSGSLVALSYPIIRRLTFDGPLTVCPKKSIPRAMLATLPLILIFDFYLQKEGLIAGIVCQSLLWNRRKFSVQHPIRRQW